MRSGARQAVQVAIVGLVCLAGPRLSQAAGNGSSIHRSLIRIVNFVQRPDWFSPWDPGEVVEISGSGFVIEGGLIMTNAHVVSDSRLLLVQAHNDPVSRQAEIVHIAHDCDLALLRWKEPPPAPLPALRFGKLPPLGAPVETLGFPTGGVQISSTRGVVSRIQDEVYVHSEKDIHLTVQTDAAINPGNSGGPVMQGKKVVGVAFQADPNLESVGFFIPTEVIERFLRDVEDGRYDGYPELGIETSGLENPAARARAGLADGETGVIVDRVWRSGTAEGSIERGDVLLTVQGQAVASDGSVADGAMRIPFGLLVDRMQIGERLAVRILRGGEPRLLEMTLKAMPAADAHGNLYDQLPRYYIYAGLVFVALNLETLKTFGPDWRSKGDKAMIYEHVIRPLHEPDRFLEERVVLLRSLAHPVNAGMAWHRNEVVERVNGRPAVSLEALAEALESHRGDHQVIEFSDSRRFAVLDRVKAEAAHQEILERYGIAEDRRF